MFKVLLISAFVAIAAAKGPATYNGDQCTLPFKYRGKTYSACTTDSDTKPWCATGSEDYQIGSGQYAYCCPSMNECEEDCSQLGGFKKDKNCDKCECVQPNPCKNGNPCGNGRCGVKAGKAECSCNAHFRYNAGKKSCDGVDPCERNPCSKNAVCSGTGGTTKFTCNCVSGFKKSGSNCVHNQVCQMKYTPWNSRGGGKAVYLDRHTLSCAGDTVMTYFHLDRTGDKIRYSYKCCSVPPNTCVVESKPTGYNADGGGNFVYLDRHAPNCGNGFLKQLHLVRSSNHKQFRYDVKCCSSKRAVSCYTASTGYSSDGGGKVEYLDRQSVNCRSLYSLAYFHLNRKSDHKNVRYTYKCCKLV